MRHLIYTVSGTKNECNLYGGESHFGFLSLSGVLAHIQNDIYMQDYLSMLIVRDWKHPHFHE